MSATNASSLLISVHDVSPVTLPACVEAVALLGELGVPPRALTILVIPYHDEKLRLHQHPPTVDFVRNLERQGACLVMHGLTHRMDGRAWSPVGLAKAHAFARGQGELYAAGRGETARRLDEAESIFQRAGLPRATRGFVPPAWLLSPAAREVVAGRGFAFYEVFAGVVARGVMYAPAVIGWGSLNAIETVATGLYAGAQARLVRADTRLAIHPADMARPSQKRSIRNAVARLSRRMRPLNYEDYLTLHHAAV